MRKEDVRRVYQDHDVEEVDLSFEGPPGSAPALDISKGQEELLVAELDDNGRVYRISIGNPKFATKEGIRVGSTLGEAKRHYGNPVRLEWDEGLYAIFDFKPGTLSFHLYVEPYSRPEYVTDHSKILAILVGQP